MPRTLAALVIALISVASVFPSIAGAQTATTSLEKVAAALGAQDVRSLEIAGSGTIFAIGQNATPTMPWPRFNLKSFARSINYETASLEVRYLNYRDFGGVKFPTKIQQFAGGFPVLELVVTDVRPNAAVTIEVPDTVQATPEPYARVTSQMVADGVWFLSGGTHNSALIEDRKSVV